MFASIPRFLCRVFLLAGLAPAQDLHFRGQDGAAHSLHELRGHTTVVNFWATWCGPCREEMPMLQKLSDAYETRGVRFIAISLDAPETQSGISAIAAKRGFRIPVWIGATDQTLSALGLGVLVPATLILDENGEVISMIEGQARAKDLTSRLNWQLAGRTGKRPSFLQKNDW